MGNAEIETIDPENAQSDKTVCFDSDSGEIENPVSNSDETMNTAPQSIKSRISDPLPDLIDESYEEEYFINAVDNDQVHHDWNIVLQANDSQVEHKHDTGSQGKHDKKDISEFRLERKNSFYKCKVDCV